MKTEMTHKAALNLLMAVSTNMEPHSLLSPVPSCSPSYIIDVLSTDTIGAAAQTSARFNIYGGLTDGGYVGYIEFVVYPWIQMKIILGLMARWKVLYLINGYDSVWSILQHLRILTKQPPPPQIESPWLNYRKPKLVSS